MSKTNRTWVARVMIVLLAFSAVFLFNVGVLQGDVLGETSIYALENQVGNNRNGNQAYYGTPGNNARGGNSNSANGSIFGDIQGQQIESSDQDMVDFFNNHNWGPTGEQMASASAAMSPITNLLGKIAGYIVILTMAGVVVITGLDLLYIAIPPVRSLLYKAGTDGTGAPTAGFGGPMGAASQGGKKNIQWVSDEAVACAAMLGGSAGAQPGGMGGMPAMQAQQQGTGAASKSVILTYFKKRVFFLVLLAVCIIVLSSSAVMGTGVNLANWVLKIFMAFNTKFKA